MHVLAECCNKTWSNYVDKQMKMTAWVPRNNNVLRSSPTASTPPPALPPLSTLSSPPHLDQTIRKEILWTGRSASWLRRTVTKEARDQHPGIGCHGDGSRMIAWLWRYRSTYEMLPQTVFAIIWNPGAAASGRLVIRQSTHMWLGVCATVTTITPQLRHSPTFAFHAALVEEGCGVFSSVTSRDPAKCSLAPLSRADVTRWNVESMLFCASSCFDLELN